VYAKVDRLVPKVWHKSKITEKRRVLRLVPESGTSHDHVGTGDSSWLFGSWGCSGLGLAIVVVNRLGHSALTIHYHKH